MEQGFKFLSITAGMNGVPNVIMLEDGQVGNRISYNIVRFLEGLEPYKAI